MKYKIKSLLDAFEEGEINVMGQQCNCFHKMYAGIAPLIANKWPEVRDVDNATVFGDISKLGHFSVAQIINNGLPSAIYNLYGQFNPGPDTRYESLDMALTGMATMLAYDKDAIKIGFPKLGCGIGGGDWKIIEGFIKTIFVNQGFDVTIYVLNALEIPEWVRDPA